MMKDQCKHCDGDGKIRAPNPDDRFYITAPCPDCGGTGYDPVVTLPAKVVDDVIAAIVVVLDQSQHVAHRTRLARTADALIEAVRLAQEAEWATVDRCLTWLRDREHFGLTVIDGGYGVEWRQADLSLRVVHAPTLHAALIAACRAVQEAS